MKEKNLLIETDLRQRLMATLCHDVSNPLQTQELEELDLKGNLPPS